MMKSNTTTFPNKINESIPGKTELFTRYKKTRSFTEFLCKTLKTEDYVIQSMPDVSPTKWHLAHVSWFFETFILMKADKNYKPFNEQYSFLFNSYYIQVGDRWIRARRGLLSRPTVSDVYDYREYIDNGIADFFEKSNEQIYAELAPAIEIGINHEQQHQELMLTDIKHVFSVNPLNPVFSEAKKPDEKNIGEVKWKVFEGGLFKIGSEGNEFVYDNETPKHKVYAEPFKLGSRLITNGEFLEFIEDGGYEKAGLWLSDGWATVNMEQWNAPLYWVNKDGEWWNFTLNGFKKVNNNEPVAHISYYEADAYARWAGARLPSEAEWEIAAALLPVEGNFVDSGNFNPACLSNKNKGELHQMYGDVWEWTQSPYTAYPGYKTLPGALGEYNGKFMSGQMVLRGGSCATSKNHIRKTYRNFFPPNARWQFMGLRLAKDNF